MTATVQSYLENNGIVYEVIPHRMTTTSVCTAQSAHVDAGQVAKPVILEDDTGYLMAIVPANRHVRIGRLGKILHRRMGLATENELRNLFSDCELGAIPPLAPAYNMQCIVDDQLLQCDDIYFESGNHKELVHIKGKDFQKLMKGAPHSHLCLH
jgi:Ala-tRNA(Pro) deacylase